MQKTVVLNVVGLTPKLLKHGMPKLSDWATRANISTIESAFPAVTCTAQADYLTGETARTHGVVGNGWYFRDECEVHFWKQSNKLVQAPKIWDIARAADPSFTCANLFWWFNMYSSVDYSVTPRPMYLADGRKLPDVYTHPANLRNELQSQLGTFPLFEFWGPRASIKSSQWIAESAKLIEQKLNPTLTLIYLPHLDYNLQRVGPSSPKIDRDLQEIDTVCGNLINYYESRGAQIVVLSEYGITDVSKPVHINRILREHGLIAIREEQGLEVLDAAASAAFAVADHQVAHVYVNDRSRLHEVRSLLEKADGIECVFGEEEKAARSINHSRSGELIAVSRADAWFTYYYWMDDRKAPDFARTVDIHRKPGYDPVELFLNPTISLPPLTVGWKLIKRKLGFRALLDVIPLDATLVKGSHGRWVDDPDDGSLFISKQSAASKIQSTDVFGLLLEHLGLPAMSKVR